MDGVFASRQTKVVSPRVGGERHEGGGGGQVPSGVSDAPPSSTVKNTLFLGGNMCENSRAKQKPNNDTITQRR